MWGSCGWGGLGGQLGRVDRTGLGDERQASEVDWVGGGGRMKSS